MTVHFRLPRYAGSAAAILSLIIALTIIFVIVALCFPYGVLSWDTAGYYLAAGGFRLFAASAQDGERTIPYGIVLHAAQLFREPSIAIFWMNALLYGLNIVLVFLLGKRLFASTLAGWLLAGFLLWNELSIIRTVLSNVHMLSDPFYSNILLLGTLLVLIGWLARQTPVSIIGCIVLGIAILTRPVGMVLIPMWVIFIFLTQRGRWKLCTVSLMLLLVPFLSMSLRNAMLYGQFKTTATAGHNVLSRVLPLLQDTDQVLPDQALNTGFIRAVRDGERAFGTDFNSYAWGHSAEVPGPFFYLSATLPSTGTTRDQFTLDSLSLAVAKRIILKHPSAYITMTLQGYHQLSRIPSFRNMSAPESLLAYAQEIYKHGLTSADFIRLPLYPPDGTLPLERLTLQAAVRLSALFSLPGEGLFAFLWSTTLLWVALHLCVIAAASYCLLGKKRYRAICAMIVILFMTAALQYLLTSAVELPLERYALPGELALHLAGFLCIGWGIWALYDVYCRIHSSKKSSIQTQSL